MSLTADASVFVSAGCSSEIYHEASLRFLRKLRSRGEHIFCPSLFLAECVSAIARQTGQAILSEGMKRLIQNFPNLSLISLDTPFAERAAQIASNYRLRGADAVYVAVADRFGSDLISWDREMLNRGSSAVAAMTPSDWLNNI